MWAIVFYPPLRNLFPANDFQTWTYVNMLLMRLLIYSRRMRQNRSLSISLENHFNVASSGFIHAFTNPLSTYQHLMFRHLGEQLLYIFVQEHGKKWHLDTLLIYLDSPKYDTCTKVLQCLAKMKPYERWRVNHQRLLEMTSRRPF